MTGPTPVRRFRIEDDLWERFTAKARAEGSTASDRLRRLIVADLKEKAAMPTTDYLADAPDYTAWAGTGPIATRIHDAGGAAVTDFRGRVNAAVGGAVAAGTPVADALDAYDPETIGRDIVLSWAADCRRCGTEVTWTTAAWEPRETEMPTDGNGHVVCDACHGA